MGEKYIIRNKYLADALAFLGFKYYKQTVEEKIIYIFDNTNEFNQALEVMTDVKKKYGIWV